MIISAHDAIDDKQRKQLSDAYKFVHLSLAMKCEMCNTYRPAHGYIFELIETAQNLIRDLYREGKYTINQYGNVVFDYDDTLLTEFKLCYSCKNEMTNEHSENIRNESED